MVEDRNKPITQADIDRRMVGITCDNCGFNRFIIDGSIPIKATKVTQTLNGSDYVVRRRVCRRCQYVIWTRETKS